MMRGISLFALALVIAMTARPAQVAAADAAAPNLNGLWQIAPARKSSSSGSSAVPALTAEAAKQYVENKAALNARKNSIDTMSRCLPPGVPRVMNLARPFKLVQNAHMLAFLFEWNHISRWVYIDREHFEPLGPSYLGQSVAKWEGGTLVIDSTNFNAATFLDDSGLPHSEQLHVVERLSLKAPGELEDRITMTDPMTFTKPWETVLTFKKRPGERVADDDWCIGSTGLVSAK
jgi:hypothetical protein